MVTPDPLTPTREEIAVIFGNDYRIIRAFERLFERAGTETPEDIEQIQIDNSANEVRSKTNRVLVWLSM